MNSREARFRKLMLAQVGKPYIFGYEVKLTDPSPRAFDCSELVQWAYYQMGVSIVDGSFNQYPKTTSIPVSSLRIGDLFFLRKPSGRIYHVGIYVGNGEFVEARNSRVGVVRSSLANVRSRGGIMRRYAPFYKKVNLYVSPTRPYPGYVLRRGAKGADVKWVQERLLKKGYKLPQWGADGDFGDETYAAVKKFREAVFSTRPQYGNVGHKTWAKLAN